MLIIDVDKIWFVDKFWPSEGKDINKYETTSTNTKPEVVLSVRGSHLEKSIARHISVVAVDPEWHDYNGDWGQNWNWIIWRTESKKFLIGRSGV